MKADSKINNSQSVFGTQFSVRIRYLQFKSKLQSKRQFAIQNIMYNKYLGAETLRVV